MGSSADLIQVRPQFSLDPDEAICNDSGSCERTATGIGQRSEVHVLVGAPSYSEFIRRLLNECKF